MSTHTTVVNTYDAAGNINGTRTITYETSDAEDNSQAISAAATAALSTNRAFVALASPTNAQVVAQVKALSRQNNGIIRLLLSQLDGTD